MTDAPIGGQRKPVSSQLVVADQPARLALVDRLIPLAPRNWVWVPDDRAPEDSSRPRARVSQRVLEPGGTGSTGRVWVTFALTVSVPSGDGLQAAETSLDDEVDALLHALSTAHIPWSRAEKHTFDDEAGRLGYQIDIRIYTTKRKAD